MTWTGDLVHHVSLAILEREQPMTQNGETDRESPLSYRFTVKGASGIPPGAVGAGRLHKTGTLTVAKDRVQVDGQTMNMGLFMLFTGGFSLSVGFLVTVTTCVEFKAQPGSPAWVLMFLGRALLVGGLAMIVLGLALQSCFKKTVCLHADPRNSPARFDMRRLVTCFQFDDGAWIALRLAGDSRYREHKLLEHLKNCYQERLIIH